MGCRKQENPPDGPRTLICAPGARLSCSQFDTWPPGTRLTVIETVSGRDGVDDSV